MKIVILVISIMFLGCENMPTEQLIQTAANVMLKGGPLTEQEAGLGIKEALTMGIKKGVTKTSQKDGFLGNALIKIAWPQEAQMVQNTLNQLGLNSLTAQAVTSMNRAAEKASDLALPLFVNAITEMSIADALKIVQGGGTAATEYLKRKTQTQLIASFKPDVVQSLKAVDATKHWSTVMTQYNQIPLVKKVNPSLEDYVTTKAIDGLFTMIGQQEKEIRANPQARTTQLLQKVFGQ